MLASGQSDVLSKLSSHVDEQQGELAQCHQELASYCAATTESSANTCNGVASLHETVHDFLDDGLKKDIPTGEQHGSWIVWECSLSRLCFSFICLLPSLTPVFHLFAFLPGFTPAKRQFLFPRRLPECAPDGQLVQEFEASFSRQSVVEDLVKQPSLNWAYSMLRAYLVLKIAEQFCR